MIHNRSGVLSWLFAPSVGPHFLEGCEQSERCLPGTSALEDALILSWQIHRSALRQVRHACCLSSDPKRGIQRGASSAHVPTGGSPLTPNGATMHRQDGAAVAVVTVLCLLLGLHCGYLVGGGGAGRWRQLPFEPAPDTVQDAAVGSAESGSPPDSWASAPSVRDSSAHCGQQGFDLDAWWAARHVEGSVPITLSRADYASRAIQTLTSFRYPPPYGAHPAFIRGRVRISQGLPPSGGLGLGLLA